MIDLGAWQRVNALGLKWRDPYARRYAGEYWTGEDTIDQTQFGMAPTDTWLIQGHATVKSWI
jgi:hypothetical protein